MFIFIRNNKNNLVKGKMKINQNQDEREIDFNRIDNLLIFQEISTGAYIILIVINMMLSFLPQIREVIMILFMVILSILLITLSPYILYVLFKHKKYSWIIAFIAIVMIPSIVSVLFIEIQLFDSIISYFLVYFILLKLSVSGWIRKIENEREYKEQKIFNKELRKYL